MKEQDSGTIFALDIGTRSIIGMLGRVENGRFYVTNIEKEEHDRRAMLDGQIVEIEQVASVAGEVIRRLEEKSGMKLKRVCVAAAGRALRSQSAGFTLKFDELRKADADLIGQLEAGAVTEAERLIAGDSAGQGRFYMVGYTARQYVVDGYPMTNLMDHRGQVFEADVVSTFLPSGVVESLYAVTSRLGLEVSSLTLEPIAALNAAIPADIRLLNLVLVDIGAGTSDIAVCREGSVVGYTMATVAGDEITELLMRSLLVDFKTGERLKLALGSMEPVQYPDILGLKHEISPANLSEVIQPAAQKLAKEIAGQILELNGGVPSAVFLAGGGSKLQGLTGLIAGELDMSEARVALAGNHFGNSAFSDEFQLADPEYATPLGIGASAALGMINDSYMVTLNGYPAKLFRNGTLNLRDVLLMNGYHYGDMMGRTGGNLSFTLNGQREFLRGMPGVESKLSINGEQAEFSTVVRAGDRIEFVPARAGQAAGMTLGELLGQGYPGTVLVNGQPQPMDYDIRQGDEVTADGAPIPPKPERRVRPVEPPKPKKEAPAIEKKLEKELEAAEPEERKAKAEPESKPEPSPEPEPEKKTEAKPEAEPKPAPAREPQQKKRRVQKEEPQEKAQTEEPLPGQLSFGGLQVVFNGAPLRLEPKAEGGEYYLMDLLERSGLDFSKIDRPVDLLVNGAQGQFSQVLRPNDQITIRYRDE